MKLSDHDFKIIDLFKFTVANDGFSHGSFHLDNRHLSSNAISEIEKQIGSWNKENYFLLIFTKDV